MLPRSLVGAGPRVADFVLFDADTGGGTKGGTGAKDNGGTGTPTRDQQQPNGSHAGSDKGDEWNVMELLPEEGRNYIQSLRQSEAASRAKLREYEQRDKEREAEARKAEEDRLAKQQEWQALAEKRAKELDALKPAAERAAQLEARIMAANQARIEKVPEALRSVIPTDYDAVKLSEWLDANLDKLSKAPAPNTDGGQRGDRTPQKGTVQLTPLRK